MVMGAEAEKQARVAQTGRGNFHLHLGFTMPHTKFTIVDMGQCYIIWVYSCFQMKCIRALINIRANSFRKDRALKEISLG
jgi:hypothetical protein